MSSLIIFPREDVKPMHALKWPFLFLPQWTKTCWLWITGWLWCRSDAHMILQSLIWSLLTSRPTKRSTLDENVPLHYPSPVKKEDHLSNDANYVHQLNYWDVCVDEQLWPWPYSSKGGEWSCASLPGPPSRHHIISNRPQTFFASRPQAWSDLKVISTDKHGETVIRGISQAVFV